MRHVYLTLQAQRVITELLHGDVEAIRAPFHPLLYYEAVSWLADRGAATFNSFQAHARNVPPFHAFADPEPLGKLPFVPHLGALRLNAKAQVEHRALGHFRGFTTWDPDTRSSSPTGVRLVPRKEELVSDHRLDDTYASLEDAALTRRMHAEGSTDAFVSEDESTWHVAFSVEPRQRIAVEPLTKPAATALQTVRIAPRVYVHVYPYGGVTVTLGLSLLFDGDRLVDDVIPIIRMLTGRRAEPAFSFAMRGIESASAPEFIRGFLGMTLAAITPSGPAPHPVHIDYALSLPAGPNELSDIELSGLLTLDDRYAILKARWVEARASLYGKYTGDRVVASAGSLAVATSPEHFPPSGRRRFFWRCHAIKEFAKLQCLVLDRVGRRLAEVGTAGGPDEATAQRLMAVAEHLVEFPRGLPAHHRKWFYECQRLTRGASAIDRYFAALAELHQDARHAAMMRRMEEPRIRIDVSNSRIGTLNLGTIIGDVENHLSAINDADHARDALRQLAEAVVATDNLSDDKRRELLEHVDLLAEEASRPPERRRGVVVRSTLAALAAATAIAGDLSSVWSTLGPVLVDFFGG